jgi:protein-S-isoprenylcysteine O-methyltransferase Ste14
VRLRAAAGTFAFLVLAPGVVAGLVPWLLTGWRVRSPLPYWAPVRVAGALLVAAGVAVLLPAFARFAVEGIGTPAPVAPTERLVVGGLYRYVRNPMYLAVTAIIAGQALALGQLVLLPYAATFGAIVAGFVRW